MFIRTMQSELTKLLTTKSFYWITILYFVFVFLGAGITGWTARTQPEMAVGFTPAGILNMVPVLGVMLISIQAVLTVTNEYSHKYQSVTFLATPNRILVAAAKWVVNSLCAFILTFIAVVAALYLAKILAGGQIGASLDVFGDPYGRRYFWLYPLQAVLMVTYAQAFAWITRNTAAGIAIVLLADTLEGLISILPRVSEHIFYLMPLKNLSAFMKKQDLVHILTQKTAPWGWEYSLWYFIGFLVIISIIAIVTLQKRDV